MKVVRNFNSFERQKFAIAVLAACFLLSLTFISLPNSRVPPSPIVSLSLSLRTASTSVVTEDAANHQKSEDRRLKNATVHSKVKCDEDAPTLDLCEEEDILSMDDDSSTSFESSGSGNEKQMAAAFIRLQRNSSSAITVSSQRGDAIDSDELDARSSKTRLEGTPLCDTSDPRVDVCEMDGDIRIHGNSSSVTLAESPLASNLEQNKLWEIRPYPRKGDSNSMGHVKKVLVRSSKEAPSCTKNHSVPAIVFSLGGYAGNLFHDFTDVIIPLFLTARQFDGEVQFLASDMNIYWVRKYQLVLQNLSRYPIIDFHKDNEVHCYTHVIVGLRCNKELSIDPSRSPNGYSMVDFTRFMRSSLALERDSPISIGEQLGKKPRLFIITRKRTRAFLNVDEVVHLAEELGFEVVATEPLINTNVSHIASIINSCDVLLGVHGAGLTNIVYLPTNSIVIQIVPWGGLEWISKLDFGDPAKDMKLNYLEYSIVPEESSLLELYPRDNEVFKNPFSYHNKGWDLLRNTFMIKQNIRVDVKRFKDVLLKALEILH